MSSHEPQAGHQDEEQLASEKCRGGFLFILQWLLLMEYMIKISVCVCVECIYIYIYIYDVRVCFLCEEDTCVSNCFNVGFACLCMLLVYG